MAVLAGYRHLRPGKALTVGHDTNILALGFQDRTLFDVEFEHCVHLGLARTDFFITNPADALQLIAELQAFVVGPVVGPVLCMHTCKDA